MVEPEEDAQRYYRGVAKRMGGFSDGHTRLAHKPSHNIAIGLNTSDEMLRAIDILEWRVDNIREEYGLPSDIWIIESDVGNYKLFRFPTTQDASVFKMTLIDDDVTATLLE